MQRFCTPNACGPDHMCLKADGGSAPRQADGGSAPRPVQRDAAQCVLDPTNAIVVHDSGRQGGPLDGTLLKHVHESTHMLVADGAGDGQIAFDDLKRDGVLPNVIVRHYDQAHGARRLCARPWSSDVFTDEVVETLVYAKESLGMIISNSEEFGRWLKANLQHPDCQSSHCNSAAVASSIRKHRWDTMYVPLAQAVVRRRAMVRTAIQISIARKKEFAGNCADYFLLFVSGTPGIKRLLLLAMLTDAADESMLVLRAQDKKISNPADTAFWISTYISRIQTLFLEEKCLQLGYTKIMMDELQKPLVYVVKGSALQSGSRAGASHDDVQFCLDKMKCWARLAIATARAEFPDFGILHAMSIFSLRPKDLTNAHRHDSDNIVSAGTDDVDDKIKTLADAFGVDLSELTLQYLSVQPAAQAIFNDTKSFDDRAAWRDALQKCMQSRRRVWDVSKLLVVVLVRSEVWSNVNKWVWLQSKVQLDCNFMIKN